MNLGRKVLAFEYGLLWEIREVGWMNVQFSSFLVNLATNYLIHIGMCQL